MNIQKLTNHTNSPGSDKAESTQKTFGPDRSTPGVYSDKVSLELSQEPDEEAFAKIELAKLEQPSFEKLREIRAALDEYKAAHALSSEEAAKTEIGEKISDPDVLKEIARRMSM